MSVALEVIHGLASGQWGLLTARQAEHAGVKRMQLSRLAGSGVLERVEHGIYAVGSADDQHQGLHAAWLAVDPERTAEQRIRDDVTGVVASHTSAAALHQMGDLESWIPVLTMPERHQTKREVKIRRGTLQSDDVTLVDGLPTTTPERTIADLIADRHDLSHVADALADGVRSGIIDQQRLQALLDPLADAHGFRDGKHLLGHLMELGGVGITSVAASEVGQVIAAAAYKEAFSDVLSSLLGTNAETLRKAVSSLPADMLRRHSQVFADSLKDALTSASVAAGAGVLPEGFSERMLQSISEVRTANPTEQHGAHAA